MARKTKNPRAVLITGGSSGIGKETGKTLLGVGHTVYVAARRVERMEDLEELGCIPLKMDVTKEEDLVAAVERIERDHGGVEILVNNAGYGSYGAIEDVPLEEAKRQFEVNIFGLARLTQLVLPRMREKHYGKIVNISSVGGKIYTPFGGWYHATKHALEGFSDCLRLETKQFGIDVVIVEPGGIATEWGAIAAEHLKETSGAGAYADMATSAADGMAKMYASNRLSHPSVIAKTILKAVSARKPKTRYAAGAMSWTVLFLRRWLSDRMFDRIVMGMV